MIGQLCFNNIPEWKWDKDKYVRINTDLETTKSRRCLCGTDCKNYPCPQMKETEKTETTLLIGIKIIHPSIKTEQGYEQVKDKKGNLLKQIVVGLLPEIDRLEPDEEEEGGDATTPQEL